MSYNSWINEIEIEYTNEYTSLMDFGTMNSALNYKFQFWTFYEWK